MDRQYINHIPNQVLSDWCIDLSVAWSQQGRGLFKIPVADDGSVSYTISAGRIYKQS